MLPDIAYTTRLTIGDIEDIEKALPALSGEELKAYLVPQLIEDNKRLRTELCRLATQARVAAE